MKRFLFIFLIFETIYFTAQTKREQIEILKFRVDSLNTKLLSERFSNSKEKHELDSVIFNLESQISDEVFGQRTAITEVVDKILVSRAGLKPDNKPVGSFVFMGPTGCGKTETAKVLAKNLGVKLIRFDMSEYQ